MKSPVSGSYQFSGPMFNQVSESVSEMNSHLHEYTQNYNKNAKENLLKINYDGPYKRTEISEKKIEELLDSPGWRHRKDNIDFSPFDPYSPDVKKKKSRKIRNKKVINSNLEIEQIANDTFDITEHVHTQTRQNVINDEKYKSSTNVSRGSSRRQKPPPISTLKIKMDESALDFENYVKYKKKSNVTSPNPDFTNSSSKN